MQWKELPRLADDSLKYRTYGDRPEIDFLPVSFFAIFADFVCGIGAGCINFIIMENLQLAKSVFFTQSVETAEFVLCTALRSIYHSIREI